MHGRGRLKQANAATRRFPIDQRGAITFRLFFWIILFSLAVYVGYKVVPPTVSFYMMRGEVNSEIKKKDTHLRSDDELAARLLEKAETWSIPIKRDDIIIRRTYGSISVNIDYRITFTFFDRYKRVKKYRIDVKAPLKGKRRD
jgi:hypothetical protein